LAAKLDQAALAPQAHMARLYEQAGQHDKAVQAIEAAVRAGPNDIKTRLAATQWALDTGQYDEARKHIDAALQINPASVDAKHLKGLVAIFRRDFPVAEQVFRDALAQNASSFAASNNLAVALAEQEEPAKRRKAVEYAQANVKLYPRQAEVYSTAGWVLYRAGLIDEAERAFQMAAAGGNVSPDSAYFMARIALDRKRPADARQLLQSALKSKNLFLLRKEAEQLLEKTR
jgi:Tfp pilus assembly protein PilF